MANAIGTRRGSGFNWSANKKAPGFNGPGEFRVKLSSVSDVPSGAITNGLFWLKIFWVSINNLLFLFFFWSWVSFK